MLLDVFGMIQEGRGEARRGRERRGRQHRPAVKILLFILRAVVIALYMYSLQKKYAVQLAPREPRVNARKDFHYLYA